MLVTVSCQGKVVTMATYNQTQTVFALSMLSGLGSCFTGPVDQIESNLLTEIGERLRAFEAELGEWQVAWGPAVYQAPLSSMADNVMFVAQSGAGTTAPGQLVVAVAGTNPYSPFDWMGEDGLVFNTVPWPYAQPVGLSPQLSAATYLGLSILQSLMPGPGMPGVGTTLIGFLSAALAGANSTPVTLTGHSLGGALAPALCLWLSDTQSSWDGNGVASLACVPIAGPTSGNEDFASYYDAQQGAQTIRLYNRLDMVPHAWAEQDMAQIPALYEPDIPESELVDALVAGAELAATGKDYGQIVETTAALPGTVNTAIIDPNQDEFANFFNQVVYQHVDAYFDLLGVPGLLPIMTCVQSAANVGTHLAAVRTSLRRKLLIQKKSSQPLDG